MDLRQTPGFSVVVGHVILFSWFFQWSSHVGDLLINPREGPFPQMELHFPATRPFQPGRRRSSGSDLAFMGWSKVPQLRPRAHVSLERAEFPDVSLGRIQAPRSFVPVFLPFKSFQPDRLFSFSR